MRKLLLGALVAVLMVSCGGGADKVVVIKTNMGDMTVILYDETPMHKENFIQSIRTRSLPNADIGEGHRSATLVHLGNIAYRVGGRSLRFAPSSETFVDDAAANRLLKRDYRDKFQVPEIV